MSKLLIMPQLIASLPQGDALQFLGNFITPLVGSLPTLEGLKHDGTYETIKLEDFDGTLSHKAYVITYKDKAGTLIVKLAPTTLELLTQGTAYHQPCTFRATLSKDPTSKKHVTIRLESNGVQVLNTGKYQERTPLILTWFVSKVNYCLPINHYPREYKDYILTVLKHCYYSKLVRF